MLVIDDAPEFLELIAGMLRKEGYDVSGAPDGNTGVDLAREAARISLPYFRSPCEEIDKGGAAGFDPVTRADREAEAAIRRLIEARYPKGLDIRDFFDQPTIRGLAEVLAERVRSGKTGASVSGG